MSEPEGEHPVEFFKLKPPKWLSRVHQNADLGYLGFHPPRPGQEEDSLRDKFVKEGFSSGSGVAAENFSALPLAREEIAEASLIFNLDAILDRVTSLRAANHTPPNPATFRLPGRATVNELRRSAWVNDLANPEIPLQKLGRSVPSGFKGHDLLDMLQNNEVTIPRAIWYIRVLGGNETQGMRNRPTFNPTQYSIEWTNIMTSYLKKLMADITLPSPPRGGLNIRHTFKNTFIESDSRDKWASRCSYFLDLLHACYCEGLIDKFTFLSWLSAQSAPSSSTLPQLSLVCRIAEEYAESLAIHRSFVKPFISDCLSRIADLEGTQISDHLPFTLATLRSSICRLFLANAESFISPQIWRRHDDLLHSILKQELSSSTILSPELKREALFNLDQVRQRNEALLFRRLPERSFSILKGETDDVQALNQLGSRSEPSPFVLPGDESRFASKVRFLLMWSVTELQFGDHRIYAAASVLNDWMISTSNTFSADDEKYSSREFLQDLLFDWLEFLETQKLPVKPMEVARLYGELIRRDLFSYHKYLQRLIARGDILGVDQTGRTCHSEYLRLIPLFDPDVALLRQRKIILYGHKARDTREEAQERFLRKEISSFLPEIFETNNFISESNLFIFRGEGNKLFDSLESATPHEVQMVTGSWLLPSINTVLRGSTRTKHDISINSCSALCDVFARSRCFPGLLDYLLLILQYAGQRAVLEFVLDVLLRFSPIWIAMQCEIAIAHSIGLGLPIWHRKNIDIRLVLRFVSDLNLWMSLPLFGRELIEEHTATLTRSLLHLHEVMDAMPPILTEVLLLAQNDAFEAPRHLAVSLWEKYNSSSQFGWIVWDNTFASIRQIPSLFPPPHLQHLCALKYGSFISEVADLLVGELDEHIGQWLSTSGVTELKALDDDIWEPFVIVLDCLIRNRVLRSSTVFLGVLRLVWRTASTEERRNLASDADVMLRACIGLAWKILACSPEPEAECLSSEETQRFACERLALFHGEAFNRLISTFPIMIKIEDDVRYDQTLRNSIKRLRLRLISSNEFQAAASKNFASLRSILNSILLQSCNAPQVRQLVCDAGKDIISGYYEDNPLHPSRTHYSRSPWCLAHTTLDIQLTLNAPLKVHGGSLTSQNDFIASFFTPMTPEQFDIIADSARNMPEDWRGQFLVIGLDHLGSLVEQLDTESSSEMWNIICVKAGEVLRMLAHLIEPWKDWALRIPSSQIDWKFLTVLAVRLGKVLSNLQTDAGSGKDDFISIIEEDRVVFLLKSLQFVLAFATSWTLENQEVMSNLHCQLLGTIVALCRGGELKPAFFDILVDTTNYLNDELPSSLLRSVCELNRCESITSLECIPRTVAFGLREQLTQLLHFDANDPIISDLVQRGESDNFSNHASSMQPRPWEWLDQTDLPEELGEPNTFKNNTSIGYELFDTLITKDYVLEEAKEDSHITSITAGFHDATHSLTVFQSDWIDSRRDFPDSPLEETIQGNEEITHDNNVKARIQTSPAPSSISRVSNLTSNGSWKQSPMQISTVQNDVESESSESKRAAGYKRQASSEEINPTQDTTQRKGGKATRALRGRKR